MQKRYQRTNPHLSSSAADTPPSDSPYAPSSQPSAAAHESSPFFTNNPEPANLADISFSSDYDDDSFRRRRQPDDDHDNDDQTLPLHHQPMDITPASTSASDPIGSGALNARRRGVPGQGDLDGDQTKSLAYEPGEKGELRASTSNSHESRGAMRKDRPAYKPRSKTWVSCGYKLKGLKGPNKTRRGTRSKLRQRPKSATEEGREGGGMTGTISSLSCYAHGLLIL